MGSRGRVRDTRKSRKIALLPELKMAADADEEISRVTRDEAAIQEISRST